MDDKKYEKLYDYEVAAAVADDPQTLYDSDWEYASQHYTGQKWFGPLAAFAGGCSIHYLFNINSRRPWWAGIYMYPIYGIPFAAVAFYARIKIDEWTADRDAVYRHYVKLHPEDFQAAPRQKYGELLMKWYPVR